MKGYAAGTGPTAETPAVAHCLTGAVSGWDNQQVYESYRDNVIGALPGKHDLYFAVARRGTEAHRRPSSAWEALFDDFNTVLALLDEAPHEHLLRKCFRHVVAVESSRRAAAARSS